MAVKNTTPTKEQIEAKRSKATDEVLASNIAFASSIADMERNGDLNAVQADMLMDLYGSKVAKLLNGRDAGLDAHGQTLNLKSAEDIRDGLAENLARIANLGPEGCEECEKHWEERMEFMRTLNKTLIVAQGEAIKNAVGTDAARGKDTPDSLTFMKPEGNA